MHVDKNGNLEISIGDTLGALTENSVAINT